MARTSYTPKSTSSVNNTGKKSSSTKKSSSKSSSKKESFAPLEVDKKISAGVRAIENGFIVSESGYTGTGKNQQWVNKEYFSETNPLASITKVKFGKK